MDWGNVIAKVLWELWVLEGDQYGWFWRAGRAESQDPTAVLNKWKLLARDSCWLHTPHSCPSPQPHPTLAPLRARISGFYSQGSKKKESRGPVSFPPAFRGGMQRCVLSRDPVDVGNGCGAVTANRASAQKSWPQEIVQ